MAKVEETLAVELVEGVEPISRGDTIRAALSPADPSVRFALTVAVDGEVVYHGIGGPAIDGDRFSLVSAAWSSTPGVGVARLEAYRLGVRGGKPRREPVAELDFEIAP